MSNIGYGALQQLKSLGIKVYVLPERERGLYTLEEAIEMFIEKRLGEAVEPTEHKGHGHGYAHWGRGQPPT